MKSLDAYATPPVLIDLKKPQKITQTEPEIQESSDQDNQVQSSQSTETKSAGPTQEQNSTSENTTSGTPFYWKVLMVLSAGLYLIPEAIFNAQLVNVSGQGVVDHASFKQIELFGRMISGIGVSLLVCDAIGSRFVRSGGSAMGVAAISFLICWPAVFFGQKILVDQFIIDPSTAEDRQHAYLSQLTRSALANNTIEIEGVEYDPDHDFNPQEMTFMALFGGMVYADDKLAQVFEERGEGVIAAMVKKDAYRNFDTHWASYSQLYDRLEAQYKRYADGSREYNSALAGIPDEQAKRWGDVQSTIEKGWSEYRSAVESHVRRARANAEKYGPMIYDYFKRRSKCRSNSCRNRLDKRYDQEIAKLGLGEIHPTFWYAQRDKSVADNVSDTIGNAIGTLGISLIAQGVDLATGGDGGFEGSENVITNDIDHYEERIKALPKFEQKFVNRTGYPSNIGTYTDFKYHPNTSRQLVNNLAKTGISLPNSWTIRDRAAFNRVIRNKITNTANARWEAKTAERDVDLPPNIPWKKFQVEPQVQERIKTAMGDLYVQPTYADWNQKTFKERILDPAVDRRAREIVETLKANQATYADGGVNEDSGKQMLRAIVVPPISMGLSLLLVILTLLKLPSKTISLFRKKAPAKPSFRFRAGLGATRFALILAIPMLIWTPAYTAEGSTVHYFLDKTAESGGGVTKGFLSWVLHAQPLLHPLGDSFERAFGMYEGSANTVESLERLDDSLLGNH